MAQNTLSPFRHSVEALSRFLGQKSGVAGRKREINKHREGDTSRQEEHESNFRENSMYVEPSRQDEARGLFSLI